MSLSSFFGFLSLRTRLIGTLALATAGSWGRKIWHLGAGNREKWRGSVTLFRTLLTFYSRMFDHKELKCIKTLKGTTTKRICYRRQRSASFRLSSCFYLWRRSMWGAPSLSRSSRFLSCMANNCLVLWSCARRLQMSCGCGAICWREKLKYTGMQVNQGFPVRFVLFLCQEKQESKDTRMTVMQITLSRH